MTTAHLDKILNENMSSGTFATCFSFNLCVCAPKTLKSITIRQRKRIESPAVALEEPSRIFHSFLSSVQDIPVLAQFDMTNHPHRLPDSDTLPARLIHQVGREQQRAGASEGNRDVAGKDGGRQCTRQILEEFMSHATSLTNTDVAALCCSGTAFQNVFQIERQLDNWCLFTRVFNNCVFVCVGLITWRSMRSEVTQYTNRDVSVEREGTVTH